MWSPLGLDVESNVEPRLRRRSGVVAHRPPRPLVHLSQISGPVRSFFPDFRYHCSEFWRQIIRHDIHVVCASRAPQESERCSPTNKDAHFGCQIKVDFAKQAKKVGGAGESDTAVFVFDGEMRSVAVRGMGFAGVGGGGDLPGALQADELFAAVWEVLVGYPSPQGTVGVPVRIGIFGWDLRFFG